MNTYLQNVCFIVCIAIGLPLCGAKLLVNYVPPQNSQGDYGELTITASAPEWVCNTVYDYKLNKDNDWTYDDNWGMCGIAKVKGRILHRNQYGIMEQTPFEFTVPEKKTGMYEHIGIKIYSDGMTQPLNYDSNTKKK
jgi:hypothetical protein